MMTNRCSGSAYAKREDARQALGSLPRPLLARRRPIAAYCDQCDKYHLVISEQRKDWVELVRLVAQGFTYDEISKMLGNASQKVVKMRLMKIRRHFYALSNPNLVAICISLGIIDPSEFVPKREEPQHGRPKAV